MFTLKFKADSKIEEQDFCLFYNTKNEILLRNAEGYLQQLPRQSDLLETDFPIKLGWNPERPLGVAKKPVYLGDWTEEAQTRLCNVWLCGAPEIDSELEFTGGSWHWEALRGFLHSAPASIREMTFRGLHVRSWLGRFHYCTCCGEELVFASNEIALQCLACDAQWYPTISPAMIVAITRNEGQEILLAQPNNRPHTWYSLIAGYCEAGESIEETVVREVREEIGITVKNIHSGRIPFRLVLVLSNNRAAQMSYDEL